MSSVSIPSFKGLGTFEINLIDLKLLAHVGYFIIIYFFVFPHNAAIHYFIEILNGNFSQTCLPTFPQNVHCTEKSIQTDPGRHVIEGLYTN